MRSIDARGEFCYHGECFDETVLVKSSSTVLAKKTYLSLIIEIISLVQTSIEEKLTGFLHFEHVTEPQSGQIKRRCFGRAKKPDEHLKAEEIGKVN